MDWNQTCDRLRNRMFALARCPWEEKVECVQGPVLTAALEGEKHRFGFIRQHEGQLRLHRNVGRPPAEKFRTVQHTAQLLVRRDSLPDDRAILLVDRRRRQFHSEPPGHRDVRTQFEVPFIVTADVRCNRLRWIEVTPSPLNDDAFHAVGFVARPELLAVPHRA